jgi:hypothetical protein
MKTLRFVICLLYRYYSKGGTKDIPYFSALSAIALLLFIHIMQVVILFELDELLLIRKSDSGIIKYKHASIHHSCNNYPVFFSKGNRYERGELWAKPVRYAAT